MCLSPIQGIIKKKIQVLISIVNDLALKQKKIFQKKKAEHKMCEEITCKLLKDTHYSF